MGRERVGMFECVGSLSLVIFFVIANKTNKPLKECRGGGVTLWGGGGGSLSVVVLFVIANEPHEFCFCFVYMSIPT
jgi:hypothetical protein